MKHAIISYLGKNKPKLITSITSKLTDLGGEFSGVTFATLGRACELTMVYSKPDNIEIEGIKDELQKIEPCKDGEFNVNAFHLDDESGPTTKITHRIILSGEDQKGLLHKIINTLDENSAVIVRMNTEKITFPDNTQYISRFAIAVREDNAPKCLSEIVKVAGQMKLTFRYETS